MKVRIQMIVESDDAQQTSIVEDILQLERSALCQEELGLTLLEAKQFLQGVQQTLVDEQVKEFLTNHATCPHCSRHRGRKGKHEIAYRTLFGKLTLTSPRFYDCHCQAPGSKHSSSPLTDLLVTRTSPELIYLETKFASLMSYGLTVSLLSEVLPIEEHLHTTAVRRHLHSVAERIEEDLGEEQFQYIEGCPYDWERLPRPGAPLTVGLDGGYVHAKDQKSRTEGWFEVIAGKSVPAGGGAKCFAFVSKYDTKPKRRLFEVLKSQGLQMNQQVVFFSDGGDTVRDLQMYLSPESEHWLDWFHITMRLTVMKQMAKGMSAELRAKKASEDSLAAVVDLENHLESLKWHLWHGDVFHSLKRIQDLEDDLGMIDEDPANKKKLIKSVDDMWSYIYANQRFIPNYGDRYRHNETISTAFVESTVNYVISKRFVKKQQMRWTQRGAHLLLQTRTQVLNEDLRKTFSRWYPKMKWDDGTMSSKQAA